MLFAVSAALLRLYRQQTPSSDLTAADPNRRKQAPIASPEVVSGTPSTTKQTGKAGKSKPIGPSDVKPHQPVIHDSAPPPDVIIKPVANVSVTLDETAGLQNATDASGVSGDRDDNDIDISRLPQAFSDRLRVLLGVSSSAPLAGIGAALSGYTGAADSSGSNLFTIDVSGVDLTFTDAKGISLNGLDSGLFTTSGQKILLYTDNSNNNILLGRAGNASGAIVFAAYIDETATGGKIWTYQNQAIKHQDSTNSDDGLDLSGKLYVGSASSASEFSFTNVPSGQNLFLMLAGLADASGYRKGIVITGKNPADQSTKVAIDNGDRVNTIQAAGSTSIGVNNQWIDPAANGAPLEGLYVTFVKNPEANYTGPGLDPDEADLESNIQFGGIFNTISAGFMIAQTQSAANASTLKLSAYFTADGTTSDHSGVDIERGASFIDQSGNYADDLSRTISQVSIRDASGKELISARRSDQSKTLNGLTITFDASGVTLIGVKSRYSVVYSTSELHNRVLIENAAKGTTHNASFDICGFHLTPSVTATPLEIGSKLRFEDDGPSDRLDASGGSPELIVDETNLLADASGSFASQFVNTPSFGTDGSGGMSTSTYALNVQNAGVDSGLVDVVTGHSVYLYLQNGLVVGRAAASADPSGTVVFNISVDPSGVVSLDQIRALRHLDASGNPSDSVTLRDNALVTLTRTDAIEDGDGDTSTASATILIGQDLVFADDVPQALDDTAQQGQANADVIVNVFANDKAGADGVNLTSGVSLVDGSVQGEGRVEYVGNGEFRYVPAAGEEGEVSFQYTITDGDADVSTATVTIQLAADSKPSIEVWDNSGDQQPKDVDGEVSEGGLPGGNLGGSTVDGGTLAISVGNDQLAKLEVIGPSGSVDVTSGGSIRGDHGTLTIAIDGSGGYSWSYELTNATTETVDDSDAFTVKVTDSNGDEDSDELVVTIADDQPEAVDDEAMQVLENEPVMVNVLANDKAGADGVDPTSGVSLVAGSLDGSGTLMYLGDGKFEYAPAAGEEGEVSFRYTITDGDADVSTATVRIELAADSQPSIEVLDNSTSPKPGPVDAEVMEGGLPGGNLGGAIVDGGTLSINVGNDKPGKVEIIGPSGSVDVTTGGSISGEHGMLTVAVDGSGVYSWSYTLSEATSEGVDDRDAFTVKVTDSNGDTASDELVVKILDDVPRAVDDSKTVKEGATLSVSAINGVLANDTSGADGWDASGAVVGVNHEGTEGAADGVSGYVIDGSYGRLTLNRDGSYTYVATANAITADESDVFTYSVRDADGDVVNAKLTINLTEASGTPTITQGFAKEQGIPDASGQVPGSKAGDGSNVASGPLTLEPGFSVAPQSGTTPFGSWSVDASGNYQYTLTKSTIDASGTEETDGFTYTATDQNGNTVSNTVVITIEDDVPVVKTGAPPLIANVYEDSLIISANQLYAGNPDASTGTTISLKASELAGLVTPGADGPVSISLNTAISGSTGLTQDGHAIHWSYDASASTIRGIDAFDNSVVFTIANAAGDFTFTLDGHIDSLNGTTGGQGDDFNSILDLAAAKIFVATDQDGDSVFLDASGSIRININNDVPVWQGGSLPSNDITVGTFDLGSGGVDGSGNLPVLIGADGPGTVSFLDWIKSSELLDGSKFIGQAEQVGDDWIRQTSITSGGASVYYAVNSKSPDVVIGTTNRQNPGDEMAIALTISASAETQSYTVDVLKPLDAITTYSLATLDGSGGSGPTDIQYLLATGEVVSSLSVGQIPLLSLTATGGLVQTSNAGGSLKVAVGNEWVESNETLTVDLGLQGGTESAVVDQGSTFDLFVDIKSSSQNDGSIQYTVLLADGKKLTGTEDVVNGLFRLDKNQLDQLAGSTQSSSYRIMAVTLEPDPLEPNPSEFRVGGLNIATDVIKQPFSDAYQLTVVDADGDSISDSFKVTYDPAATKFVAPVVLDLAGNGIEYVDLAQSNARFDYAGDGVAERTAWITAGAALLVYDHNDDRLVNDGSEISFVPYAPGARTDLEGLRLAFDSNLDGIFDVRDERFADFGVWVDSDEDGATDAGEYFTLTQAGITGINLSSDGLASTAANGDVLIHGSTTFTLADGSIRAAQDVSIASLLDDGSASSFTEQAAASSTSVEAISSGVDPISSSAEPLTSPDSQPTHGSDQQIHGCSTMPSPSGSEPCPTPQPSLLPEGVDPITGADRHGSSEQPASVAISIDDWHGLAAGSFHPPKWDALDPCVAAWEGRLLNLETAALGALEPSASGDGLFGTPSSVVLNSYVSQSHANGHSLADCDDLLMESVALQERQLHQTLPSSSMLL